MKTPMETIRERQQVLEADLQEHMISINDIVSSFIHDTGMPVAGVQFRFVDATAFGGPKARVGGGIKVWYGA